MANINKVLDVFAGAVGKYSLEPVAIMHLARVWGVNWHVNFCEGAAGRRDWAYLKWLRVDGCPWDVYYVYEFAIDDCCKTGSMDVLSWIKEQTLHPLPDDEPLEPKHLQGLMLGVGRNYQVEYVEWLCIELRAPWPDKFFDSTGCWSVEAVEFALEHGSGWRNWR